MNLEMEFILTLTNKHYYIFIFFKHLLVSFVKYTIFKIKSNLMYRKKSNAIEIRSKYLLRTRKHSAATELQQQNFFF